MEPIQTTIIRAALIAVMSRLSTTTHQNETGPETRFDMGRVKKHSPASPYKHLREAEAITRNSALTRGTAEIANSSTDGLIAAMSQ